MVHHIVNQAHLIVSIRAGKLYPVTTKYLAMRKVRSDEKSDTEEYSY